LHFVLAQVVLQWGNKTHSTQCGCNEAAGYIAVDGDVENCQRLRKCLVSSCSMTVSYNTKCRHFEW